MTAAHALLLEIAAFLRATEAHWEVLPANQRAGHLAEMARGFRARIRVEVGTHNGEELET